MGWSLTHLEHFIRDEPRFVVVVGSRLGDESPWVLQISGFVEDVSPSISLGSVPLANEACFVALKGSFETDEWPLLVELMPFVADVSSVVVLIAWFIVDVTRFVGCCVGPLKR